jgi:hypothetical protein
MRKSSILHLFLSILLLALCIAGCSESKPEHQAVVPPKSPYPTLPPRANVPDFMKGTVWEVAEMDNKNPFPVSGYGMVTGLDRTGNNNGVPMTVRNYIVDDMVKHGMGSANENLQNFVPERVLEDPRTAIVEVWGLIPVGARAGQRVDIWVQAPAMSQTTSLARGHLYQMDLYDGGVNPMQPKGRIKTFMKAKGAIFVNPAYSDAAPSSNIEHRTSNTEHPASDVEHPSSILPPPSSTLPPAPQASARASLRTGMILGGGICTGDREIFIRLRQPQLSMSRAIEYRVVNRFRDASTARAQDEGLIYVYVPQSYNGDWEHFMGVAMHLYLNESPGFAANQARKLIDAAIKPNAPLADISYCWEGIGEEAIPFIQPLYLHNSADVAYSAARAGAFLGDPNAEQTLVDMASAESHPFQLNAVKTLGSLPDSPRVKRALDRLVTTAPSALVRIEAYKILAERGSNNIITTRVGDSFILDRVFSMEAPLVYATRSGVPRIAIFGKKLGLQLPLMFSAMENRLTISSRPGENAVSVFDRTSEDHPRSLTNLPPDLGELVLRLGNAKEDGFRFGYGDLVSILKQLSDNKQIAANFVLQDLPQLQEAIEDAPPLVDPTAKGNEAQDLGGVPPQVGLKNKDGL